MPAGDSSLA